MPTGTTRTEGDDSRAGILIKGGVARARLVGADADSTRGSAARKMLEAANYLEFMVGDYRASGTVDLLSPSSRRASSTGPCRAPVARRSTANSFDACRVLVRELDRGHSYLSNRKSGGMTNRRLDRLVALTSASIVGGVWLDV